MEDPKIQEAIKKVRDELLLTWQPVAAIATRANIPIRTALKILVALYNNGEVKMSYSRIDGHNKVHMFKKIEFHKFGRVVVPIDTEGMEL